MTEGNPDPHNGDYDKLNQSYQSLQSKLGEQGTELGNLRQQVTDLSTQLSSKPTPPTQTEGQGGSLFDWSQGQMRTDSGEVNPNLYKAMQAAGAEPQHVDQLISTIETAKNIVETRKSETIQQTVGSQDNLNSLLEWAGQNNSSAKVKSASQLIKNIDTLSVGLEMLKSEAESSGFKVGVENTPAPTNNEPSPLPANTGNIHPTLSPLVPNTEEALKAVRDPRYVTDANYREEVSKRLALGMK